MSPPKQLTLLLCNLCYAAFDNRDSLTLFRRPHHWSFWCVHYQHGEPPCEPKTITIQREYR